MSTQDFISTENPQGMPPQDETVALEIISTPMRMSADIGEIAAAFCAAQAEFEAARKSSENPAFRSKYADLASVIEAALPALNKAGIGVLQPARLTGESVTVVTRLQHKSGQFFESELTMPVVGRQGFTAQAVGTAVSYARRYSLQALICLSAEDDDGNAASGVGTKEAAQAVGTVKTAVLTEKVKNQKAAKEGHNGVVPALFYTQMLDQQDAYLVDGSDALKRANWPLLKPFWNGEAIVLTGDQLEDMKFQMEQRHVEFRAVPNAK